MYIDFKMRSSGLALDYTFVACEDCGPRIHALVLQRSQKPVVAAGDSVMQHNTACMHYNTLKHTSTHCNMLQHTATHCSTLKHIASCCNKLRHTATHRGNMCGCLGAVRNLLWLLVTRYCNTMQHTRTATHCNTLDKLQ